MAEALGVTKGAVSQWVRKAREGGRPALRHRKPPGGPSKLSDPQRGQLPELLSRGRPPSGSAERFGRGVGLPKSSRASSAYPTTRPKWDGY